MSGLEEARRFLRDRQANAATGHPDFPYLNLENISEQSLSRLQALRRFELTSDPSVVRRGVFRFDAKTEEERIHRSEDLVRRVQPGPFEDPDHFAALAYQAASFEMTALPMQSNDGFSRFLLGTIRKPIISAGSEQFASSGYTVVLVNSGLMDFMIEAAKATVEAVHGVLASDNNSFIRTDTDMQKIRAELKLNHAPANRLYRTLESYFYDGDPHAAGSEALAEKYVPIFDMLVAMAERWTLAHEYGHGFALDVDFSKVPRNSQARVEEYFADGQATIWTCPLK
jgi:hypothetical protein